jgi:uncharacterized protein with LGFP repeats
MRFYPRHIGSGVWGVFDAGVMGWRATDGEDEAHQQAADLNVIYNQYGQRDQIPTVVRAGSERQMTEARITTRPVLMQDMTL